MSFYRLKGMGPGMAVATLDDAKAAGTICVVKDDAREQLLVKNGFEDMLAVQTDAECPKKLDLGEADLWFGSSTSFVSMVKQAGMNRTSFELVYTVQSNDLYIAFSKGTPDEEVAKWQAAFDAMKKDGTFGTIKENYGIE